MNTKLKPQDHRSLLIAHRHSEVARMQAEIATLEFQGECERLTKVYKINPQTQSVNLDIGEIVPMETGEQL